MKNTFGQSVAVTIFGESHGTAIGAVFDGFAPGVEVDEAFIASQLAKRQGQNNVSTARRESDRCHIVSGVFEGKTTGTPICMIIQNENTKSKDYSATKDLARPGHADYTAFCKYHGFQDYRGGGHFSGRITAPLVAAGAIAIKALEKKGIRVCTHILSCAGVNDRSFNDYESDFNIIAEKTFPVLDDIASSEIEKKIVEVRSEGDSVGGILQTAVLGVPSGVGEPWFDTAESMLSHALFSVPAVKGVEFGAGFEFAKMAGSTANDPFRMNGGDVVTSTNNNGGINGGITNGMPILFNCAVKPTPSIYKEQNTVDFVKNEDAVLQIKGRHDPAIIHRAAVVVDSVTALTICDMLAMRFGTDFLKA
ncbi:MAG: chorismate synthase [Faecalibacterium sp.]|nr:chorismate synthase [Ruminococcus sp.]MCM1393221.1 chorismate synthase [Ruminococcus sp.]MCM1485333.1 chorismate synthase [Faecalibacterium sp.]